MFREGATGTSPHSFLPRSPVGGGAFLRFRSTERGKAMRSISIGGRGLTWNSATEMGSHRGREVDSWLAFKIKPDGCQTGEQPCQKGFCLASRTTREYFKSSSMDLSSLSAVEVRSSRFQFFYFFYFSTLSCSCGPSETSSEFTPRLESMTSWHLHRLKVSMEIFDYTAFTHRPTVTTLSGPLCHVTSSSMFS